MKVGGVNSYDVLADKYSRLKRRYFELEQVSVFSSLSRRKMGEIRPLKRDMMVQKQKETAMELQRSGERNSQLRAERK
ncbi:hypothetical protein SCHPADRAFT_903008 [Schizopora paradoxa]|uniref:Uncharacterized protein n=1 Tax=Schizopora paradoxa TaxID=27342 RepID=A0A0H2RYX6_9AGAM|nr:hypothetical protein SCHPADRAFT_903008 [Schizopora paradoxa]